jgi:hypothetical protein
MSIASNLYATLNANSGVRAIVGIASSPQESRIYPGVVPDGAALPHIKYSIVSEDRVPTIPGTVALKRQRIQIECHAAPMDYDAAQALGDAVYAALVGNGYQEFRTDIYSPDTMTHVVWIDWSFMA